jgi:hypothetical protein
MELYFSRNKAISLGLPRYIGKVCAKHPELNGERYVASYGCITCAREAVDRHAKTEHGAARIAAYLADHGTEIRKRCRSKPESQARIKAYAKEYYQRPGVKERMAETGRKPEIVAQRKKWREENHAHVTAEKRIYKAWRENHVSKKATPPWANKKAIAAIYAHARRMTVATGEKYVVDHIVPLKHDLVCGLHVEHNLQVIPERDNLVKNNSFEPG